MKNFLRVATLIFGLAGGVYGYELVTGTPIVAPVVKSAIEMPYRMVVSKSPPHRIRTDRTINTSDARPQRPPQLERMIEARGGSDFPVLLPQRMTKDAGTAEDYEVRLKLLDDGYSAVITTADMDIVIYGTNRVFRRKEAVDKELAEVRQDIEARKTDQATGRQSPNDTSSRMPPQDPRTGAPLARIRPPYTQRFEELGEGKGGSISMGRFGVDYHIEFFCHNSSETAANCIDEAGARAFLQEMEEDYDDKG